MIALLRGVVGARRRGLAARALRLKGDRGRSPEVVGDRGRSREIGCDRMRSQVHVYSSASEAPFVRDVPAKVALACLPMPHSQCLPRPCLPCKGFSRLPHPCWGPCTLNAAPAPACLGLERCEGYPALAPPTPHTTHTHTTHHTHEYHTHVSVETVFTLPGPEVGGGRSGGPLGGGGAGGGAIAQGGERLVVPPATASHRQSRVTSGDLLAGGPVRQAVRPAGAALV